MGAKMKSPDERYLQDPQYRQVVDMLESFIHKYHFSPSELREMAVMACIRYEMRYGFKHYVQSVPMEINQAFEKLERWRDKNNERIS